MNCLLIDKKNSLLNELRKQRAFLLINISFAENKLIKNKDYDNNKGSD